MVTRWCCWASTMDGIPTAEDGGDRGGWEDKSFFIEGPSSSDDELEFDMWEQKHHSIGCQQTAALSGKRSPPLLLAFSITSGRKLRDDRSSPAPSVDAQAEDETVEEWMILGREEQPGDSRIQLNLSYWNSCEDDSPDEGEAVLNVVSGQRGNSENNTWAVSEKDKSDTSKALPVRYFLPGRSNICSVCNRSGHLSSSCYYHKQKCTMCILCGVQGHVGRDCPSRPCSSCGLPPHGLRPCERPPVWNQHCQRCGMTGHLLDACPDTWRQYHLTVTLEVPLRPQKPKHKKSHAYCYNCSGRNHYGHECTKRRMISGTSPLVPYVCHYDTSVDVAEHHTRMHRVRELLNTASTPDRQPPELMKEGDIESRTVTERSRVKLETWSRADRRKTWPERRRARREVKRLRREAQARREGTLLKRSQGNYDDEDVTADSFRSPLQGHWQSTVSPHKKRKGEDGGQRARKWQKWKKRGGIKQGRIKQNVYIDADMGTENFNSVKQRVRQRRR